MWLDVGEREDCMAEVMYQGPGCGCRQERPKRVCWTQCIRSQDVVGGMRHRGLYGEGNV